MNGLQHDPQVCDRSPSVVSEYRFMFERYASAQIPFIENFEARTINSSSRMAQNNLRRVLYVFMDAKHHHNHYRHQRQACAAACKHRGHVVFRSIVCFDSYYICPPGIICTSMIMLSPGGIVVKTKCWCVNMGGYAVFGSIMGSD